MGSFSPRRYHFGKKLKLKNDHKKTDTINDINNKLRCSPVYSHYGDKEYGGVHIDGGHSQDHFAPRVPHYELLQHRQRLNQSVSVISKSWECHSQNTQYFENNIFGYIFGYSNRFFIRISVPSQKLRE